MSETTLSRRSLIKGAALGAAALFTGSMFSGVTSAFADDATAPADDTTAAAPAGGDYDIVIVGMGGAGMCAALAAKEAGIDNLVILEKTPAAGGNTVYSSSGMNASETTYQKEQGIEDNTQEFIDETIEGGHYYNNPELVTEMCEGSADAIDWLTDHGLVLNNITFTAGMSIARCHRPTDGSAIGASYVPIISDAVANENIDVIYNCRVDDVVVDDDGTVTGVIDTDGNTYNAKAVILTCGGFGSNPDMIKMYRPDLEGFVSTNAPSIVGDGMIMAQHAGANLIQMDQIQTHPTVYEDGSLVAEAVRGGGAIIINDQGERFVDEMDTRDVVSAAEEKQPDKKVWVLYDQTIYDNNTACAGYANRGMSVSADSLADLASTLGVDANALQQTVDTYNQSVGGATDPFGRTTGFDKPLETAPFYAIPVWPGIHHCMGGIYVDTDLQALTIMGAKIPGLYAAGEVTGGFHGANRIGGNAICDITVNGIRVGQKVAEAIS